MVLRSNTTHVDYVQLCQQLHVLEHVLNRASWCVKRDLYVMMFHINTARINYVQLCQLSIARRATRGKEGSQTIAYTTLLETPLLEQIKLPAKLVNEVQLWQLSIAKIPDYCLYNSVRDSTSRTHKAPSKATELSLWSFARNISQFSDKSNEILRWRPVVVQWTSTPQIVSVFGSCVTRLSLCFSFSSPTSPSPSPSF